MTPTSSTETAARASRPPRRQGPPAPRVSVVIPAHNEADTITPVLDRIFEQVTLACEVLVVVDRRADTTVPVVEAYAADEPRLRLVLNDTAPGPAHAIRAGFAAAAAPVVVTTMADGSDDPAQIDTLARLVERGVVIAAASRYMRGGQQVGGPALKKLLSRGAGTSLKRIARVGITDATNSFKAYDKAFVEEVGIESCHGFEIGLELVAKAHRTRRMVAEVPTIWLDRSLGESRFRLLSWLPAYLRWYRFAFGRRIDLDQLTSHSRQEAPA